MNEMYEVMARQSAQLRLEVNTHYERSEWQPEETMADNRPMSKLREKLLGLGGEELKLKIAGDDYLLVAPTQKKRGQIQSAAMRFTPKKDAEGKPTGDVDVNMDNTELKVRSLAACLRDPDTRQLVFGEDADLEALRESTVAGVIDRLMDASMTLLNPTVKEVEKNSAPAPGESSSSALPES